MPVSSLLRSFFLFARCENTPHNGRIELVLSVRNVAGIVFDVHHENRKRPLFVETFLRNRDWQNAI